MSILTGYTVLHRYNKLLKFKFQASIPIIV